jgi:hypothetical protein
MKRNRTSKQRQSKRIDRVIQSELAEARLQCVKLLKTHLGDGGYQAFLSQPQPSFQDRTGSEILNDYPHEILERLRHLETSNETVGGWEA